MKAPTSVSTSCNYRNSRENDFYYHMLDKAPLGQDNADSSEAVQVQISQDGPLQQIHRVPLEFWCLNIGGPDHPNRISMKTENNIRKIDLRKFYVTEEAFDIFQKWTEDLQLPSLRNEKEEIAAFEAYFLGWHLGAVVFTNQLMNVFAEKYEKKHDRPPMHVLLRAFQVLHFKNRLCDFIIHAWSRTDENNSELENVCKKYTDDDEFEYLPNLARHRHKFLTLPDSFEQNIEHFHTHFEVDSDSDLRLNWISWVDELEKEDENF